MVASRSGFLIIACLGALLLGAPATTGAYLVDTDTATANHLTVGTLDAKLTELGPASEEGTTDDTSVDTATDTWEDTSHRDPSLLILGANDVVNNTLRIDNAGSDVAIDTVNLTIQYTENDSGGTSGNPDSTMETLVVDSLTYQGSELVGSEVVDENGNGVVDLHDTTMGETATNLSSLNGIAAGGSADLTLVIDGDAGLLGLSSGDGVDITIRVQVTGMRFADTDSTENNTIIYA